MAEPPACSPARVAKLITRNPSQRRFLRRPPQLPLPNNPRRRRNPATNTDTPDSSQKTSDRPKNRRGPGLYSNETALHSISHRQKTGLRTRGDSTCRVLAHYDDRVPTGEPPKQKFLHVSVPHPPPIRIHQWPISLKPRRRPTLPARPCKEPGRRERTSGKDSWRAGLTLQRSSRDAKFPPKWGRSPVAISCLRPGDRRSVRCPLKNRRNSSHGEIRRSAESTFIDARLALTRNMSRPALPEASKTHFAGSLCNRRNQPK